MHLKIRDNFSVSRTCASGVSYYMVVLVSIKYKDIELRDVKYDNYNLVADMK